MATLLGLAGFLAVGGAVAAASDMARGDFSSSRKKEICSQQSCNWLLFTHENQYHFYSNMFLFSFKGYLIK